jgi:hypothetical protein
MSSFSRIAPDVALIAMLCAIVGVWYASQQPTKEEIHAAAVKQLAQEYQIIGNVSLSQQERAKELKALIPPPSSGLNAVSIVMFASGTALLIGSLAVRRRSVVSAGGHGGGSAIQYTPTSSELTTLAEPTHGSRSAARRGRKRAAKNVARRQKAAPRRAASAASTPGSPFLGGRPKLPVVRLRQPKKKLAVRAATTSAMESGTPPSSAQHRRPPKFLVERLTENQNEVDAIPLDRRGVSFFTSRPLSLDELSEVTVVVGNRKRVVLATQEEAADIDAGQTPLIRAFTVNGRTSPWYEWEKYDPYRDYWTADNQEWRGFVDGAIACWIAPDDCPSRVTGYYASEDEDEDEDVSDATHGNSSPGKEE